MIATLNANWPTIFSAFAATTLGLAVKFGFCTGQTASYIGGLVVPFTAAVHRMAPPAAK